jgi:hypothetical protein
VRLDVGITDGSIESGMVNHSVEWDRHKARFERGKVAYVQFLEDNYGTAGSFKTGGKTRFHSEPSGKEVEV